uniref:DUF933 domain-containing protein n=1 Tax=Candidatus Phytoplasma australasiaticum subsp. australasiaticum TaxID=2832407 RepID=A0A7S7FZM6_9MOLU|nr:DUF933 domain-containing protein ['Parthenium hysterophorus' phyllody phytoplasma]
MNLQTYFTAGPKETRSWSFLKVLQLLNALNQYIQIFKRLYPSRSC